MAFLDLMQKIVGGAAVPETVASRYHEARAMYPDMMPLAAFTVAAIEAELARRSAKTKK